MTPGGLAEAGLEVLREAVSWAVIKVSTLDSSRELGLGFCVRSFLEAEATLWRAGLEFTDDFDRFDLESFLATAFFGEVLGAAFCEADLDWFEAVSFLEGILLLSSTAFGFTNLTGGLGAWATFGFTFTGTEAGLTLAAGRGACGGAGIT